MMVPSADTGGGTRGGRGLRLGLVLLALVNLLPATEAEESWLLLAVVAAAGLIGLIAWRPGGAAALRRFGADGGPGRAGDERRGGFGAAVVYAGVVAAIGFLIFEIRQEGTVYVLDLAHFMMLLCACKFLEPRTNRDLGLAAIIAGLVLVIGAFVSGSLLFAIAVIADVTVGVWWLLAFQMRIEVEEVSARRAELLGAAARGAAAAPIRRHGPALYRPAAAIGAAMCAVAATLFVIVPRGWGKSVLGAIPQVVATGITGFSEDVQLSDAALLESDVPVMRVRFSRNGQSIGSEDFRPYMRGVTLEQYDGKGKWRRTARMSVGPTAAGSKTSPDPINVNAWAQLPRRDLIDQEVWLDRIENGVLFALYPPVTFGSESIPAVRLNPRDQTLSARDMGRGPFNYVVQSPETVPQRAVRTLNPRGKDDRPPRRLPSVIPARLAALAKEIAGAAGDSSDTSQHERIVRALMAHLAKAEFSYSLSPGGRAEEGADPIENFVFNSHRGHCEYFASALALMCQAVDVPARLVTGYYGGDFNPVGGFYQFRQRDAHAWVEVFLPKRGWLIFDPSPAGPDRRRAGGQGLVSELKRLAAFLQFEWSTFVVAFDSDHRQGLLGQFVEWVEKLASGETGPRRYWEVIKGLAWGPDYFSGRQRVLYWFFAALCVVMLALLLRVLWIVGLLVRENLPRRQGGAAEAERRAEARFYDRLLVLLAHKGHVRPEHQTPREFAARLAAGHVELGELREITEWFYAAQYGGQPLTATARERVGEFLQRLREESGFGA